jgi:hypothetical protein
MKNHELLDPPPGKTPQLEKLLRFADRHIAAVTTALGAFAIILLILLLVALVHVAKAADATVTWAHPTQRIDGSSLPLSSIKETRVEFGSCAGTAFGTLAGTMTVAAPATSITVPGLSYGTWCFQAYTVDTLNQMSVASAVATKSFLAPPKAPASVVVN